jgi:hypothetical protein
MDRLTDIRPGLMLRPGSWRAQIACCQHVVLINVPSEDRSLRAPKVLHQQTLGNKVVTQLQTGAGFAEAVVHKQAAGGIRIKEVRKDGWKKEKGVLVLLG